MTPPRLITSIMTVFWIKGVDLSKDKPVFQTPADLLMKPNGEVNLSLTHQIPSYDMILWYQRSAGDSSLKLIGYVFYKTPSIEPKFPIRFSVSGNGEKTAFLQIKNLKHPEDSGEYFGAATRNSQSEAYFGAGTKLTVLEHEISPPNVTVLRPSAKECRNPQDNEREKTLVCVATDFYPDHVSVFWQVNGKKVTTGVLTDEAALRVDDFYKITSQLRVSAEDWYKPERTFECFVRFFDGEKYSNHSSPLIYGEPVPDNILTRDEYLRITQKAKLSYGVFILKSCVYGAFVAFLVWRLQSSTEKQRN